MWTLFHASFLSNQTHWYVKVYYLYIHNIAFMEALFLWWIDLKTGSLSWDPTSLSDFEWKTILFQINRQDPHTGRIWQPTSNSRVCSKHFVSGTPTQEHPDPVLELGNDYSIYCLNFNRLIFQWIFVLCNYLHTVDYAIIQVSHQFASIQIWTCMFHYICQVTVSTNLYLLDVLGHFHVSHSVMEKSLLRYLVSSPSFKSALHSTAHFYMPFIIFITSGNHSTPPVLVQNEPSHETAICDLTSAEPTASSEMEASMVEPCENDQSSAVCLDHSYSRLCNCNCHEEKTIPDKSPQQKPTEKVGKVRPDPITRYLKNDKTTRLNTGLPTKRLSFALFAMLESRAVDLRYWTGPKRIIATRVRKFSVTPKKSGLKRKHSLCAEFLLTLMKLRLGLTNEFLSSTFNITPSTCSSIINTWIKYLGGTLRSLVVWPDKSSVYASMPAVLRAKYQ